MLFLEETPRHPTRWDYVIGERDKGRAGKTPGGTTAILNPDVRVRDLSNDRFASITQFVK